MHKLHTVRHCIIASPYFSHQAAKRGTPKLGT